MSLDSNILNLIKYPVLTEKTIYLLEQNQYTFMVAPLADKYSIKKAVELLFDVKVTSINVMFQPIKKRRVGKFIGKNTQNKKAIVKLASGNSITFFEKE